MKKIEVSQIVEELRASGDVEYATEAQLEAYAGQISRLRDAQQRVEGEGLIVTDARQNPVPHPALAIERQAQDEIRRWSEVFKSQRPRRARI